MKTKFFILALTTMSITLSYAQGPLKISATSDPAIFDLFYSTDANSSDVVVNVSDQRGNIVGSRTVQPGVHFKLPLNFSTESYGKYYVTVRSGDKFEKSELDYAFKSSSLLSHITKLKTGKYLVSVPQGQVTTARITVFDDSNNVIFSTTKEAGSGTAFLVNTDKVKGSTSIEITDAAGE